MSLFAGRTCRCVDTICHEPVWVPHYLTMNQQVLSIYGFIDWVVRILVYLKVNFGCMSIGNAKVHK